MYFVWTRAVALGLTLTLLWPAVSSAASNWRTVADEDGIKVMSREVPGRSFPTFRTVAVIKENIYDVLAVISDVRRYTGWMARCSASKKLSTRSEFEHVTYARTDAPWPVDDRDAVYHAQVTVSAKQRVVMIRFRAIKDPRMPPLDGVVRMDKLRGYFALKMLGPRTTQMDYQVDADPGGWIPTWVGEITARRAALDTIRALRAQARKTRGWYRTRVERWQHLDLMPAK